MKQEPTIIELAEINEMFLIKNKKTSEEERIKIINTESKFFQNKNIRVQMQFDTEKVWMKCETFNYNFEIIAKLTYGN